VVWLNYARQVATPGGLYGFVRVAAGPRVALVQAALWIVSYALYLVYTTASIVYDTLPVVLPSVRRYQSLLEVAIPIMLAVVMLVEYIALSRLIHLLTERRVSIRSIRTTTGVIAAVLVAGAPVTLIDPERIYTALL